MANKVTITSTDNKITVTPQNTNTSISTTTNSVTVNQGTTKTVQINTPGPAFLEVRLKSGSINNLGRPKNLKLVKKNFMLK